MSTVEPPFNLQNDWVYAPVDNKKRYINPSRLLRMSVMASVAVSQVGITEVIFVNHGVKVKGQYYCDVLLSWQQMLPAIKRVAERCLFTKQYVAYGEIGHFLCSVISQGKVVALVRWGGKWNHLSMTHRLATNYAKNYCYRIPIVKVIVENVVTCFFGTQCRYRKS